MKIPTNAARARTGRHVLAWMLFIAYEGGGLFLAQGRLGHLGYYFLFYPLNIGLFYANGGTAIFGGQRWYWPNYRFTCCLKRAWMSWPHPHSG
jgi:hypothetical protein